MNIKRGFFRLWLVLSGLFVLAFAALNADAIQKEFAKAAALERARTALVDKGDFHLPTYCGVARGNIGVDYSTRIDDPGPWDRYATKPAKSDVCWYPHLRFRALFPEYNGLTDITLMERLNAKVGYTGSHPWRLVGTVGAMAIGVPLVILVIGCSLVWAFAGFSFGNRKTT